MPKYAVEMYLVNGLTGEALEHYASYMNYPSFRTQNNYYYAQLANWYLHEMGILGRPTRQLTKTEMNGFRKFQGLRQSIRTWLQGELSKGRSPRDLTLISEIPAAFVREVKQDADMTAAIQFIKTELNAPGADAQPITPSFNQLYDQLRNIETRTPVQLCQTSAELDKQAEAIRAETRRKEGKTGAEAQVQDNLYDVVRREDMLKMLDEYDAVHMPLATGPKDQYGPAPQLDGV